MKILTPKIVLGAALILTTAIGSYATDGDKEPVERYVPDQELLERYNISKLVEKPNSEEKILHRFYDRNDNLIYEETTSILEHPKDKRLVKYLNESDLLVEIENTKIHRLK